MSILRSARQTRALLSLLVLMIVGFTLYSLRLSDASFTAKTSNAANVFIAGNLAHVNNLNGTVAFTLTGMKPGSTSKPMSMTLTGTGDLTGDYTLSVGSLAITPATSQIAGVICLNIVDTASGDEVCDDPIGELDSVDLGSIAPGQTSKYSVTVYYPDGPTSGAAQSASLTATLKIEGVSQ